MYLWQNMNCKPKNYFCLHTTPANGNMTLISICLLFSKSESSLYRGIGYTHKPKASDSFSFFKRKLRHLWKVNIEAKMNILFLELKLLSFSINCYLLYYTCGIPLYNILSYQICPCRTILSIFFKILKAFYKSVLMHKHFCNK